ncbi:MAG: hypothetical protein HY819_19640 [Acidobacteria bacterium]|nr:hypothetical protein [Acidobacteriota bacterium]
MVRLTFYDIDAGVTYYFFVEQDIKKQWCISLSSLDYQVGSNKEYQFQHYPTAYFVEQLHLQNNCKLVDTLDVKIDDCSNYALRLFDQNKNEIDLPF